MPTHAEIWSRHSLQNLDFYCVFKASDCSRGETGERPSPSFSNSESWFTILGLRIAGAPSSQNLIFRRFLLPVISHNVPITLVTSKILPLLICTRSTTVVDGMRTDQMVLVSTDTSVQVIYCAPHLSGRSN